jgi:hypothetical protein
MALHRPALLLALALGACAQAPTSSQAPASDNVNNVWHVATP